jgi:hypothetical protein
MIDMVGWVIQDVLAGSRVMFPKLDGQSSPGVRTLLNFIVRDIPACRYLEVGVYRGSTFIPALWQNDFECAYAIDNWSQFGGKRNQFESALGNLTEAQRSRIKIIEGDCWKIDLSQLQGVNVYFYDGAHTSEDHRMAFTYYDRVLANDFVAIVDDWNDAPVREGTREAFAELGYQIVKDWELMSAGNGDVEGWWNGLYVAVINKTKKGSTT